MSTHAGRTIASVFDVAHDGGRSTAFYASKTKFALFERTWATSIDRHAVRKVFQDTLAIAYRIHLRHWYVRRFASLERARMDEVTDQAAAPAGAP